MIIIKDQITITIKDYYSRYERSKKGSQFEAHITILKDSKLQHGDHGVSCKREY